MSIRIAVSALLIGAVSMSIRSYAVPIAVIGHSNDLWEGNHDIDPRGQSQCVQINDPYFIAVPNVHLPLAISQLTRTPIVTLSDQGAAQLLDIHLTSSTGVGEAFLSQAIERMEAARSIVFKQHVGSWSQADQIVLDKLKITESGPHLQHVRPYLVRALAETKLGGGFRVQTCGDVVVVSHLSVGTMYSPPDRSAVVIFLEHAPKAAFVEWAVDDPASFH
jgi:hypothetical protein